MTGFTESNTVEAYLYDLLSGPGKSVPANVVKEPEATYGRSHRGIGWRRVASADIPRQHQDVLIESWVREALIRLNPEISAQPDRADEVLYTSCAPLCSRCVPMV